MAAKLEPADGGRLGVDRGWLIAGVAVIVVVGVGGLLFSRSASAGSPAPLVIEGGHFPRDKFDVQIYRGDEGEALLSAMMLETGAHSDWATFFRAVAKSESAFSSNAVNGSPLLAPPGASVSDEPSRQAEIEGSCQAYQRGLAQGRYKDCPWSANDFCWGSGGWYGVVAANAWYAYLGTPLACRHPWYVLHVSDHTVTSYEMARRSMRREAFKDAPNFLSARVAWGNPSRIGDAQHREAVAAKFAQRLEEIGESPDFMYKPAPALAKLDVYKVWQRLNKRFDLDPGYL